jgi:hypothetical protein
MIIFGSDMFFIMKRREASPVIMKELWQKTILQ